MNFNDLKALVEEIDNTIKEWYEDPDVDNSRIDFLEKVKEKVNVAAKDWEQSEKEWEEAIKDTWI